jgi:hypothetical protein
MIFTPDADELENEEAEADLLDLLNEKERAPAQAVPWRLAVAAATRADDSVADLIAVFH